MDTKLNKLIILTILFPTLALADFSLLLEGTNFKSVVVYVLDVIYILNPILSALAFLVFFWGLSKFILSSGNQAELEKGKSFMLWGILALFVLLSFMAIIKLISKDLEFSTGSNPPSTQNTLLPVNVVPR